MKKRISFITGILVLLLAFMVNSVSAQNAIPEFLDKIEALKISRGGYILGAALNKMQLQKSQDNKVADSHPGTIKFKDDNLFVVVLEDNKRVIIIFEHHDNPSTDKMKELVGSLFLQFSEPTLTAHSTLMYWMYNNQNMISMEKFDKMRKNLVADSMTAYVKLYSSDNIFELVKVLDKDKESNNLPNAEKTKSSTSEQNEEKEIFIGYMISSEPLLKMLFTNIQPQTTPVDDGGDK